MTDSSPQIERMGPEHLHGLDGLIAANIGDADELPPLWHWTYFLERPAQGELGPDGHPLIGHPTPPAPGLRRMFAGGRVTTHRRLCLNVPATLRTSATQATRKEGRTGTLWFATVRYVYEQGGTPAITEERDIVYRPAAPAEGQRATGVRSVDQVTPITVRDGLDLYVDETMLFRFSALTYNAHRIHYDLGWAEHEGYGGLVIHGPLQALMMGEMFRRTGHDLVGRTFSYRLVAPFVGTQLMRVRPEPLDDPALLGAVVYDAGGSVTARATLQRG